MGPVAYLVDVGVPNFGEKTNAGRRIRVVWWKLHVRLQQQTHKFDRQKWSGIGLLGRSRAPPYIYIYIILLNSKGIPSSPSISTMGIDICRWFLFNFQGRLVVFRVGLVTNIGWLGAIAAKEKPKKKYQLQFDPS